VKIDGHWIHKNLVETYLSQQSLTGLEDGKKPFDKEKFIKQAEKVRETFTDEELEKLRGKEYLGIDDWGEVR